MASQPGEIAADILDQDRHTVMKLIGQPILNEDGSSSLYGRTWVFARRAWAKTPRWITTKNYNIIRWIG